MCFEVAKEMQSVLMARHKEASAALRAVPGLGSGQLGLTPDAVKASPAYQTAREDYHACHGALRKFNAWFCKEYKAELRAERRQLVH
jgi:hypothetical protein